VSGSKALAKGMLGLFLLRELVKVFKLQNNQKTYCLEEKNPWFLKEACEVGTKW